MPSPRNRRWILAILFVTVFPVTAVHFSCVAVLGPGSWGSGVEEKEPALQSARERPDLAPYAQEWEAVRDASGEAAADPPDWAIEVLGDRGGDIVWADRLDENGPAALLTAGGNNWTEQQRLFLSGVSEAALREVEIPADMIVRRPTFLRKGDQVLLVLGRWNSWGRFSDAKTTSLREELVRPDAAARKLPLCIRRENRDTRNTGSRRRPQTVGRPHEGRDRTLRRARDNPPQPARLGTRRRSNRNYRFPQRSRSRFGTFVRLRMVVGFACAVHLGLGRRIPGPAPSNLVN